MNCITEHTGFDGVCLNVWVLQTAYSQYCQHYYTTVSSTALHDYVKTGVSLCVLLTFIFNLFSYFYFASGNTDIQHTDS